MRESEILAIEPGTPVFSSHNEQIGVVGTDRSSESVGGSHLVVMPMSPSRSYWRIPANFVAEVSEKRVDLSLSQRQLNNYPQWVIRRQEPEE